MATTQQGSPEGSFKQRALVLALALTGALASGAEAGTEIALRFYNDNPPRPARSRRPRRRRSRRRPASRWWPRARRRRRVPLRVRARACPRGLARCPEPPAHDRRARVRGCRFGRPRHSRETLCADRHGARDLADSQDEGGGHGEGRDGRRQSQVGHKAGMAVAQTRALADGSQVLVFATPLSPAAAASVLANLSADPDVAHAEVDRRAMTQAQPSDPMYVSQWNLSDPVGGIAAPQAWDFTTGDATSPVAILDTGMLPHPDSPGAWWAVTISSRIRAFPTTATAATPTPPTRATMSPRPKRPRRADRSKVVRRATAPGMARWWPARWAPRSTTAAASPASAGTIRCSTCA